MTTLTIAAEVSAAFPDTRIAAVVSEGLRAGEPWPEAEELLALLERRVAEESWFPADETDPRIADWHSAYRRFGTNPRRERPSVDALGRRLRKTARLPRICGPVDAYNGVSLLHALPAGAADLDAVDGDVVIRFATEDDTFTPIGEPGKTERPKLGEVVYADRSSVLTRHWNHRDADRTKVTGDTSRAVFLLETTNASAHGPVLAQAAEQLQAMLARHSSAVRLRYLDGAAAGIPLA